MQKEWILPQKVVAALATACCWYYSLLPSCTAAESLQNDHYLSSKFDNSQSCNDLYWLHAPKTSSTFCTTISHICCSSKFDLGVKSLKQNEAYKSRLQSGCSLPANLRQQGLACIGNFASTPGAYPTTPTYITNLNSCKHVLQLLQD